MRLNLLDCLPLEWSLLITTTSSIAVKLAGGRVGKGVVDLLLGIATVA
jgi:hypothetical protein